MAISYTNIGIAEPSTITNKLAAVTIARGSTSEQQEILTLGDPETSNALARVVAADPAATEFGLVTRQVGYVAPSTTVQVSSVGGLVAVTPQGLVSTAVQAANSSAMNVRVVGGASSAADFSVRPVQSSQADLRATIYQSTAADLNVTVAGYVAPSTTVQVSSVGGVVSVVQSNTGTWSVLARVTTSSGGGVEGSTATPSTGSVLGLNVRTVQPSGRDSTSVLANIGTANGSTELISSVTGARRYVYAFSIMSTVTSISSVAFTSSNKERWGLLLGTQSSGITGANLAVTPPGFLFASDAGEDINLTASSTGLYRVSVAWFTEP